MVRVASLLDINGIYELCCEAWDKSPYVSVDMDEMKTRSLIRDHIKMDTRFAMVSELDRKIEGVIGCSVHKMDMSQALATHNSILYVRSGCEGMKLLKGYVDWAQSLGAAVIGFDQSYSERTELTTRLVERIGFKRSGGLHMMVN